MTPTNPFRPTRFEHHDHPLIWLSPNVRLLEGLKSVYVAGTRGSGKTSLLKAINWRERLYNPTVRDQLGANPPDYVAVYFRLPDFLTSAIGLINWEHCFPDSPTPDLVGYEIFSQLIEFVGAQLICEAISSLRAAQRFSYSTNDEDALVAAVLARYPALAEAVGQDGCEGLDGLSLIFRRLHQRLNVLITRGQVHDALALSLEAQPGVFINELAARLRDLACAAEGSCSTSFHLKICIDDCETLQPVQQKFLNSLVRSTQNPLFWVVSYVSVDYDSTNTVHFNQTLSDADRTQLLLDDMGNSDFYRLCEGVSLLRVYYSDPGLRDTPLNALPRDFFELESLLGKVSINALLANQAQHSLSAEFTQLVERAKARDKRRGSNRVPSIFETYVLEKLGHRLADDREANLGAYLRRKNVAALLAICAEFRITNIPYVGATTIVSLSNGCIRDYLELIGSIFDEALRRREIRSVADLRQREVPLSLDAQRVGVRASSRAKLDGIRNIIERDWAEATRTVEFIGKLTALLQSNPNVESTLATPERGNFIFDLSLLDDDNGDHPGRRAFVTRVLRRCEADGLLRPARSDQNDDDEAHELAFHLHRRFAPEFGFSYRGPYGLLRMPMGEFAEMCVGSSETLDALVDRAYQRISRDTPLDHPKLL
ncbi:hypothetical protein GCM10022280_21610 [Sphingomonas swuensis]|uniref:ATP-binding protein n=1 Tax=Sphingomonas swuensis TaxID=977800 RepID=A0ABP7T4L3_9SPHN